MEGKGGRDDSKAKEVKRRTASLAYNVDIETEEGVKTYVCIDIPDTYPPEKDPETQALRELLSRRVLGPLHDEPKPDFFERIRRLIKRICAVR